MIKVIISERTEDPHYFDLISRFPYDETCRGFFRIGDRAAAYIQCLEWRQKNPDSKLVVIDMPRAHNPMLSMFVAEECPATWVFKDLADEIWLVEDSSEDLEHPPGKPLYTQIIWEWWYYFNQRKGNKGLVPNITPPGRNLDRVNALKDEWKLPPLYATIQPLFDAPYALYRNQPPIYWEELVAYLAPRIPLVVLGHPSNYSKMSTHPRAYSGWSRGLSVLDSLAMISGARLHIGGETGTTIWSSIMGVNTYGIYTEVLYEDGGPWFAEPIGFGGTVRVNKTGDLEVTKLDIERWWEVL